MSRDLGLKKQFFVAGKAIIVQDKKVLLLKKPRGESYFWDVPGGCIHGFESPKEALVRELQEEVPSVSDIRVGRLLHACTVGRDIKDDASLALLFYLVAADFDNDIQLSSEHETYCWASSDALADMASEGVENAVKQALKEF